MRIGLQITGLEELGNPAQWGEKLSEIARTADEAGFYSLWLPDHLLNAMSVFGLPLEAPILEGYTTISYLAACTRRIKVGLLSTCNFVRPPGLLIKMISTLDVLSGGRACLGIGAGWFEEDAQGAGIPFPPRSERLARLEETLQIAHHIWRGERRPYQGKYYQLLEPLNSPPPLTRPHPPILVGGSGERKTLRLVAQYGDACNLFIGSALKELPASFNELYEQRFELVRHKLQVLQQHCTRVGRPYTEIEKTVQVYIKLAPAAQETAEVIALCERLAELGVQHIIFNMPNVFDINPIETLSQALGCRLAA